MGKALIVYEEGVSESYLLLIDIISKWYEQTGLAVETFCIMDGMEKSVCHKRFAEPELEYICTLDMAGFQMRTVLDFPEYNVMPAKQIHIVINEKTFMLYRDLEFALNLYIFLPDTICRDCLEELYIPNLFTYMPFELKQCSIRDKEELNRMLEIVRRDCEEI